MTVLLDLENLEGENAFQILASFRKQARKQDWSDEEINEVLEEAKSGDYEYLLATIKKHCL